MAILRLHSTSCEIVMSGEHCIVRPCPTPRYGGLSRSGGRHVRQKLFVSCVSVRRTTPLSRGGPVRPCSSFHVSLPRGVYPVPFHYLRYELTTFHRHASPAQPPTYQLATSIGRAIVHTKRTSSFFSLVQVRTIARHHTVDYVGIERAKIMASVKFHAVLSNLKLHHSS